MRVARRLTFAAIGAAQIAVLAIGPFIDAPPAPAGHVHHLAAEADAGCHPYHDDHCVVCRVLSTETAGAAPAADAPLTPPLAAAPLPPRAEVRLPCDFKAPIRARAPPVV